MKKLILLFSFVLLGLNLSSQIDSVGIYINRGISYDNLGKFKLALIDFNNAIRINPNYAMAYYNRGVAYNGLGKYKLAIDDFSSAIRINPDFALAYYNRGNAKSYLKLDYCSDFKRACDLGKCDNYNKVCK